MPRSRAKRCQAVRWCARLSTSTPSRSKRTATSLRTRDNDEAEPPVVLPTGVRVAAEPACHLVAPPPPVGAAAVRARHVPDAALRPFLHREGRARHGDARVQLVRRPPELRPVRRDPPPVTPARRP